MRKIIIPLLIVALFSVSFNMVSAETSGYELEYTATTSNNATAVWWDPVNQATLNYNVEENSTITVTTDSAAYNTSLDIEIGNITRIGISDNEAESALAFGYWQLSAHFGFIANTSWAEVKTDLQELDLTTKVLETINNLSYLGGNIPVVQVLIADDYQSTELIYDEGSGVLLHASTEVFGFLLEIDIVSINQDTLYFITSLEVPYPNLYLVTLVLVVLPLTRKLKR